MFRHTRMITVLAILIAGSEPALSQRRNQPPRAAQHGEAMPAAGLATKFHDNADCVAISSPYGSTTRYDGSLRSTGGGPGATHGGIDLTLREGTPLLAIAPGTVFASGEGGMMEGIYLWTLHLPAQTGLPFAYLAKYQHLARPPSLRRGDAVALGQEVARSGLTGTVGGHYRAEGYPHLHLTVRAVPEDKAAMATGARDEFVIVRDSIQIDPLVVFLPDLPSLGDVKNLPPERRQLTIGYVDAVGGVQPTSAHAVWPVACR